MNTIIINSGSVDHHLQRTLQELDKKLPTKLILSNKVGQFSKDSRKEIVAILCKQTGLEDVSISFEDHHQLQGRIQSQLHGALVSYSSDFKKHEEQDEHTKIKCYERTLAFQIAMYHRGLQANDKEEIAKRENQLSIYTGLSKNSPVIQHYLSNQSIKKQSIAYFSQLKKAENPSVVDLILEYADEDTEYAFVGMRTEYPSGPGRIGGWIDDQDKRIAASLGLSGEKVSIISALREGMEESSGLEEKDEIIASGVSYAQETISGTPYITAQINDYKIGIPLHQIPKSYIEDPQDPNFDPADYRGPAATTAWRGIVLNGTPTGSSDLGEVNGVKSKRRSKKEIENLEWAMRHHAYLYK